MNEATCQFLTEATDRNRQRLGIKPPKPRAKSTTERYIVVLEMQPGKTPAVIRLRWLLKRLLRSCDAVRCVGVRPAAEGEGAA